MSSACFTQIEIETEWSSSSRQMSQIWKGWKLNKNLVLWLLTQFSLHSVTLLTAFILLSKHVCALSKSPLHWLTKILPSTHYCQLYTLISTRFYPLYKPGQHLSNSKVSRDLLMPTSYHLFYIPTTQPESNSICLLNSVKSLLACSILSKK